LSKPFFYRLPALLIGLAVIVTTVPIAYAQQGVGARWNPPANMSENLGMACSYTPAITVDLSGAVHLVWEECLDSEPGWPARMIEYRRFDGSRWSDPIDVIAAPDSDGFDGVAIQAGTDGRLHLVWIQIDGYVHSLYYSWAPIEAAASARAWAPAKLLADADRLTDFKVMPDHTLRVVYSSSNPEGFFLATSGDAGQTWSTTRISPVQAMGQIAAGADGILHMAWMEALSGSTEGEQVYSVIYYARSSDGGKTWSEPFVIDKKERGDTRFDPKYQPQDPTLVVAGRDQVHIVWNGAPAGQRWHRWSADGGLTWYNGAQIDPMLRALTGGNPLAVDSAGNVHMFSLGHDWTKPGVGGVWYSWWEIGRQQWTSPRLVDDHDAWDSHQAVLATRAGNEFFAAFVDHRATLSKSAMEFDIWTMHGQSGAAAMPLQVLPTLAPPPTPLPTPPIATPSPVPTVVTKVARAGHGPATNPAAVGGSEAAMAGLLSSGLLALAVMLVQRARR
jgi:hypothetical protein